MNTISYPVSNIHLGNTVNVLNNPTVKSASTDIIVGTEPVDKNEKHSEIYNRLVLEGWLDSPDNIEENTLYNLLASLRERSMAEIVLNPKGVIYPGLPFDYDDTLLFESNGDSGVKMHYSVIHKDEDCNFFKLNCQLFLDKNCQLDEDASRIYFEFYDQCPQIIKQELDQRSVMQYIFDWLADLFNCNPHSIDNKMQAVENDHTQIEYNIKNHTYLTRGSELFHFDDFYIEDDNPEEYEEANLDKIYKKGESDEYFDGFIDGMTTVYPRD
ncbi:hypothetical protein [Yersinia pekkanenii]|uniref:Uncharacterized protein n=1 Tax=Yersinia pekkanenii TaxID=1288385 RepID=A0A0T9NH73_9GAMM|nr:hypothetical protein [Yersinia pekkanenii]CNH09411.1 Uncharacterised protein [Yersinia pekkanenii]CRY64712.1 Uncharacterised protein [Yersinia pekkanenii]